jgi:hypothetical protein
MSVAMIALLLSVAGTGYAATRLPANSVGSRELKPQAVTRQDIKAGAVSRRALARDAVDSSKVARNALTGDDIDESTLVIRATSGAAPPAAGAPVGGGTPVDGVVYRSATMPLPPGDAATDVAAACPDRYGVIGGGVRLEDPVSSLVTDSYPNGSTGWEAHVLNTESVARNATVYVICVPAAGAR